jgi:hypothetical protein
MEKSDIAASRDKVLARIDQRIANAPNVEAASCCKLAKAMTNAIFDAIERYFEEGADDESENETLAKFVEIITPRAMALSAISLVGCATPEHFVAESAALLNLEFSHFVADTLRQWTLRQGEAGDWSFQ